MRLLPLLALLVVVPTPSLAQRPGTLDTSFGFNGVTLGYSADKIVALAVQSDGKILAADRDAIARYLPDGTLDESYGAGGLRPIFIGPRFPRMAMLPDDSVLVTGTGHGAVIKLLSNGLFDSTFGTGGVATAAPFSNTTEVVVQPDGKILLSGSTGLSVARLNDDGSVDMAFGTGGVASTAPFAFDNTVALQADGMIVAGGSVNVTGESTNFILARFDADGQLDATFGTLGTVRTDTQSGGTDKLVRLVMQGNDAVAVGQTVKTPNYWFTLIRYVDGVVDPTFGMAGITQVTTDVGDDLLPELPLDAILDGDGNVIVTGDAIEPGATTMRFLPDGALDSAFASGGAAWLAFAETNVVSSYATTIDAEGRILVGGRGVIDPDESIDLVFMLARYFGGGGDLPRCPVTRDLGCPDLPVDGKASFKVKNHLRDKSDSVKWQWQAPLGAVFGDPLSTEAYALCVYRDGAQPLVYGAAVNPGGTCHGKPCWKATSKGFRYTDSRDSPQGVTQISLQQDGFKTKIKFDGKGANLGGMNIVPLGVPVHVQLQASNGECWNTSFSDPTKNDGTKFIATLKP